MSSSDDEAGVERSLAEILSSVAQPVWVVDHAGVIHYANRAALTALGYERIEELLGKPAHETIHYKHRDGTHFPVAECPLLRPRSTGETISVDDDWFIRADGSMFPVAYTSAALQLESGRGAVVAFADIGERLDAEQARRERDIAEARAVELAAARRRVIAAADAERRRIARDLHDGAQQNLVNLAINLQLAHQAAPEHGRVRELIDTALEEADRALRDVRDLAGGMHPALLTTRGLAAAVESLVDRVRMPVELVHLPAGRLPAEIEASAYFFVAEALTNATKHARASRATVYLCADADELAIEVCDDGIGGASLDGAGSGLAGLADRIAALDGHFQLTSDHSDGTRLRATVPLARHAQSPSVRSPASPK